MLLITAFSCQYNQFCILIVHTFMFRSMFLNLSKIIPLSVHIRYVLINIRYPFM
jgi:hypothetical protein